MEPKIPKDVITGTKIPKDVITGKSGKGWFSRPWLIFWILVVFLVGGMYLRSVQREAKRSQREAHIQDLVEKGKIVNGLTKEEVIRIWGLPEEKLTSDMIGIKHGQEVGSEIWCYFKENSLRGDLSKWCLLFDADGLLKHVSVSDGWHNK
jgi:hypothetical protein